MEQNNAISVLLVDDHEMVREGLAVLIAKDPEIRIVGQCGDGAKALELAEQLHPNVVVLDIRMDGLNGLDACREITQRHADIRVLILTMHEDEQFIARAMEYRASGYLLKEATADQLAKAIHAVHAGELFLGEGVSREALGQIGQDPSDKLTARERQVLQHIAEGKSNRQIAEALGIAIKTVDTHRTRLMHKLRVRNAAALVKYAFQKRIIDVG